MKILIIGNQPPEIDSFEYYGDFVDFFKDAASKSQTDVSIEWTEFDDLYIEIGEGSLNIRDTRNGASLKDYAALLILGRQLGRFRDVMFTISRYAELNGVRVVNDYSSYRSGSKLTQSVLFHEFHLPAPTTVYVDRAVLTGKVALPFAFPCIMKAVLGAHGNDNYVVESIQEVRSIAENSEHRYILQRFIPNDNDFRILVVGDEAVVISRKAVNGSHLNNTSQGGEAALVPLDLLPEGMVVGAQKITERLSMKIAGVDAIINKKTGEYFFLEVNSQPQLKSGAFLEEKKAIFGEFFRQLVD